MHLSVERDSGFRILESSGSSAGQQQRKSLLLAALFRGLPTLPGYVFTLNNLLSAAPVDLKAVSQVIRSDPSLSVQVIKLCNARAVDPGPTVFGIEDAVRRLGTERLRALMLICPLLGYAGQRSSASRVRSFWQHSFLTALLSEQIARWTGYPKPEKAYVAGLLHDIGKLPFVTIASAENAQWESSSSEEQGESIEAERQYFGLDHCEMGRRIGILWGLPPVLIEVFEHHHRPGKTCHDPTLIGIVAAADQFCQRRGVVLEGAPPQLGSSDPRQYAELLRPCLPGVDAGERMKIAGWLHQRFPELIRLLEFGPTGILVGASWPAADSGIRPGPDRLGAVRTRTGD